MIVDTTGTTDQTPTTGKTLIVYVVLGVVAYFAWRKFR